MRLADKERVAAFGIGLQEVAFALVVENFDFMLCANLFAFGESAASREGACECAVFRVECGHVLVQREFELASVYVLEQVKELSAVEIPRRVQFFKALSQEPIVACAVGGVQAVVANHRNSGILEERERTEVTHECKFRHERENLFDVMVLAGLVDAERGDAGFESELVDALERFVVFHAPVKIHDDFVDVEPLKCVDLFGTSNENGNCAAILGSARSAAGSARDRT